MSSPRGLRLFRREDCLSYAAFDRDARVAAWIDADQAAMDDYRTFLSEMGLRATLALDTGACPGHRTAAGLLRAECGLELAGEPSGRVLADGERFEAGAFRLRVIDFHRLRPGAADAHGPCLLAECEGLPPIAFTGRAVPIGTWPARRLEGLPPGTLLCPSRVADDILFSTLETENARAAASEDDADAIARMSTAITIEKYEAKIARPKRGDAFVDVRERSEFAAGHMPGARNLPLSELGLHLHELRGCERVYLSCLTGRRSSAAARTLAYVGLGNTVNVLGGFQAWKTAGYEIKAG